MTCDERLDLWQYTELQPLSKKATLVRNNNDGRLMVKCVANAESFSVFEALCGIQNPNLMRVFDTVVSDGQCISLCEYVEGVTLEKAVEMRKIYSEYDAKNIIAQLCDGLTVLHGKGIIHRDINPSNVMLDNRGIVRIIDYDIMRTVKNGQNTDTQVLGTPGYAAPEQFGFTQTDERADIYSCGVLMNYLLTGFIPNEKLYFGNLTPVINKCIEMDADNRFSSAYELKKALLGKQADLSGNKKKGKKGKVYINYSKLPGFRSGKISAKFFTVLLMTVYFVTLVAYVNYTAHWWQDLHYPVRHYLTGLLFFVLISALPYICLGDVGRLSRKINPNNPSNGKKLLKLIGWLSLIAGFALFIYIPQISF